MTSSIRLLPATFFEQAGRARRCVRAGRRRSARAPGVSCHLARRLIATLPSDRACLVRRPLVQDCVPQLRRPARSISTCPAYRFLSSSTCKQVLRCSAIRAAIAVVPISLMLLSAAGVATAVRPKRTRARKHGSGGDQRRRGPARVRRNHKVRLDHAAPRSATRSFSRARSFCFASSMQSNGRCGSASNKASASAPRMAAIGTPVTATLEDSETVKGEGLKQRVRVQLPDRLVLTI